jgi:DNA-binding transcriptional ArsR family regulator
MGARRTIQMIDKIPEPPKLTSAQRRQILRLHDTPFNVREISEATGIPYPQVMQALREMCPVDKIYA